MWGAINLRPIERRLVMSILGYDASIWLIAYGKASILGFSYATIIEDSIPGVSYSLYYSLELSSIPRPMQQHPDELVSHCAVL